MDVFTLHIFIYTVTHLFNKEKKYITIIKNLQLVKFFCSSILIILNFEFQIDILLKKKDYELKKRRCFLNLVEKVNDNVARR